MHDVEANAALQVRRPRGCACMLHCRTQNGESGEINQPSRTALRTSSCCVAEDPATFVPLVAKSIFLLAQRYSDVT
jgi:hypothetical protein